MPITSGQTKAYLTLAILLGFILLECPEGTALQQQAGSWLLGCLLSVAQGSEFLLSYNLFGVSHSMMPDQECRRLCSVEALHFPLCIVRVFLLPLLQFVTSRW